MKSKVITIEDIHSLISKNYNDYCVFIQPHGITNFEETIDEFNLPCNIYELSSEEMMMEFYEDKDLAFQRVKQFFENSEYFYVALYKKGNQIITNI